MIALTVVLLIIALAVIVVGALGLTEKLPGNGVVGLRIPEARKSQENWVMAHKIAGPSWIGGGVAFLAAALLSLRIGGWMWLVFAMLILGGLFLIGMGSAIAASAMARLEQVREQLEEQERAAEGCCSAGAADETAAAGELAAGEPTADECASGNACGSCSVNGACEGGGAAFDAKQEVAALDLDAARRAAAAQDQR